MGAPDERRPASPGEVENRFEELWRETSTDGQAVVKACSMNLVVVCRIDGDLSAVTQLVGRIAATAPGRAIVVAPPRGGAAPFDVYVSAHCHRGPGGAQVCSEQVTIEPSRANLDRVPATVLQLLVEDMPVYTWWRRRELTGNPLLEPLVRMTDYWILDSAASSDPGSHLEALAALAHRTGWHGHVIDAAWLRLEAWRDAVASFFDRATLRPALAGITGVRVVSGGPSSETGASVAAAYLAGWLGSRLGFRGAGTGWTRRDGHPVALVFEGAPALEPGELGSVEIEARHRDATVAFAARLVEGGEPGLELTVRAGEHVLPRRRIHLPSLGEAALLCGVLQHTGRDAVFEAALDEAARIARRPAAGRS